MRGNLKLFELKSGRGEKLMKNILIISSSPRKKGNSQILCEQFKKGGLIAGYARPKERGRIDRVVAWLALH